MLDVRECKCGMNPAMERTEVPASDDDFGVHKFRVVCNCGTCTLKCGELESAVESWNQGRVVGVWDNPERVHDWRDYVTDTVRGMWGTFSDAQKKAIQAMAQEMADKEEWD